MTIDEYIGTINLEGIPSFQMDEEDIQKAKTYATKKYDKAIALGENLGDRNSWIKRNVGGFLGEIAVERHLGVDFIDESIRSSSDTNHPDLKPIGLNVGVKTSSIGVKYSNVALVPTVPKYPEIIVILKKNKFDYEFGDQAFICGLATKKIIMKNSNHSYVRSPNVPRYKIGFCGYHKLIPFENLNDLQLSIE